MSELTDTVDVIDNMIDQVHRTRVTSKEDFIELVEELQKIRAIIIQLVICS